MGIRHSGREAAVKILYSMEMSGEESEPAIVNYWVNHSGSAKYRAFTGQLVKGVCENRERIDGMIGAASKNWPVGRMPEVDRSITRLAVYELISCNEEVPASVAINEAVELAKQYAGKESASFINGILGKIREESKKEKL